MQPSDLKIEASIKESYHFLTTHIRHFVRLSVGPLVCWLLIKLAEKILKIEYQIHFDGGYLLSFISAAFAIVWYRQFLMGTKYASYLHLLKNGFSGDGFSASRLGRFLMRVIIITLVLIIPTLILSIGTMLYLKSQGIGVSQEVIRDIAAKSTIVVMLIFSPALVRLSLFTAGLALGRHAMTMKEVWQRTQGYTVLLWWLSIRAFLPLTIYTFLFTWLLKEASKHLDLHYFWHTLVIEIPAGILTFIMLAIVVAVNGEAFRHLIGVRKGDVPHRTDAGPSREGASSQAE